jgi:hypothetical protein
MYIVTTIVGCTTLNGVLLPALLTDVLRFRFPAGIVAFGALVLTHL